MKLRIGEKFGLSVVIVISWCVVRYAAAEVVVDERLVQVTILLYYNMNLHFYKFRWSKLKNGTMLIDHKIFLNEANWFELITLTDKFM